jgi:hypothetical protein
LVSPEYSARKHQVPVASGTKEEVAVAFEAPGVKVTAPSAVPPVAQPEALAGGPQTKKFTDPDGTPAADGSDTVAVSVTEPPNATGAAGGTPADGADVVLLGVVANAA